MPWSLTPLQAREARLRAGIATNLSLVSTPGRDSNVGAISAEVSAEVDDIHQHLSYQAKQIFTTSADDENLLKHGKRVGLVPHPATPAKGGAVTFTGTDTITIPKDTVLRHATGQTYTTDAEVSISGDTATVSVTAQLAGTDGNQLVGQKLAPVNPIAGISSDITITTALSEGRAAESIDAFRIRVLYRQAHPSMGGSDADYVVWASMIPGVSHIWVAPREQGLRTVVVRIAMYDDPAGPIPSAALRNSVLEHINGHINPVTGQWSGKPAGAEVFVPEIVAKPINLQFSLLNPNNSSTTAAIQTNMTNMLRQRAKPGGLIRYSWITEAISRAVGEDYHALTSPTGDIQCDINELATVGSIGVNA